jgi:hypothetical protein
VKVSKTLQLFADERKNIGSACNGSHGIHVLKKESSKRQSSRKEREGSRKEREETRCIHTTEDSSSMFKAWDDIKKKHVAKLRILPCSQHGHTPMK